MKIVIIVSLFTLIIILIGACQITPTINNNTHAVDLCFAVNGDNTKASNAAHRELTRRGENIDLLCPNFVR